MFFFVRFSQLSGGQKGLWGWGQRSEAWRRGTEEEGTTKRCKAIHGLLVELIYDWLGALEGRRGACQRKVRLAEGVCCKTRCWLIFLSTEGQQLLLQPHPSLPLVPYWNKENKSGKGDTCKQAKRGGKQMPNLSQIHLWTQAVSGCFLLLSRFTHCGLFFPL